MFTLILKIESRKTVMSQTKVLSDTVCAKTLMVSILWGWAMLVVRVQKYFCIHMCICFFLHV